MNYKLCELLE